MTENAVSIAEALAAAQMEMGRAIKDSTNPHFRSKYADLGNVMDACMSALNGNGIAVIQPMIEVDGARYVSTQFIHKGGESLECRIPLIVGKNDMQGLGSAITYARRYGLMCLAGIAPDDDDGNAAVESARKNASQQQDELQWFRDNLPNIKDVDGINAVLGRAKKAGRDVSALVVARAGELGLEFDGDKREYVYLEQSAEPQAPEINDEIPY